VTSATGIASLVLSACTAAVDRQPDKSLVFTMPPTVTKAGDQASVRFAVSTPTDVEVAVLSADGEIVRHLAAGVLGKNAPEPLKKDSLVQELVWDGRADDGTPAAGGPFRVRVRAGMKPELDGYLFDEPGRVENTLGCSMGVDRQGRLYYMSCPGYGSSGGFRWSARSMLLRVYDRNGRYQRTLLPFAPNTPLERLKDTGAFTTDGRLHPVWHNAHEFRMYPGRPLPEHELAVTSKGRLYALSAWHDNYINYDSRLRFWIFDREGGFPSETGLSTPALTLPKGVGVHPAQRQWIAVGPDDRWIYLSGLVLDNKHNEFAHAVYRVPLDFSTGPMEFFGSARESGADEKRLRTPKGVAVDGQGLVYVADSGNNRLVVAREDDGSLVRTIPVPDPGTVQVHPRTGAIYVLSTSAGKSVDVVKISGGEQPTEVARIKVGRRVGLEPCMVLDASAEPAVVWVGGSNYFGRPLIRFEDGPNGLVESPLAAPTESAFSAESCHDLMVDRKRNELYIKASHRSLARMNLTSGAVTLLPPLGRDSDGAAWSLSPDGETIYSFGFYSGVRRMSRDLKPLKFETSGEDTLAAPLTDEDRSRFDGNFQARVFAPMTYQTRGLGVAPNGDIHVIPAGNNQKRRDLPMTFDRISEMQVYGPDGKRKGTAIWRCSLGAVGPRFDRRGNIYLAESILPPSDDIVPDFFKDRLPVLTKSSSPPEHQPSDPRRATAIMYGSILKFSPAGGIVWYSNHLLPDRAGWGEDVPDTIRKMPETTVRQFRGSASWTMNTKVQGAQWMYYGASPFMDKEAGSCNCLSGRFDVDDYGRVFFPDVGRFRIGVLDTGGNELAFVGHYGNRDCGGNGSLIPEPIAAFAYPFTVAVSNTHIFVGDLLNNRIAKLKMVYMAEASCEVK
jgi:DNA-binding beta-propeller fold protein YncE